MPRQSIAIEECSYPISWGNCHSLGCVVNFNFAPVTFNYLFLFLFSPLHGCQNARCWKPHGARGTTNPSPPKRIASSSPCANSVIGCFHQADQPLAPKCGECVSARRETEEIGWVVPADSLRHAASFGPQGMTACRDRSFWFAALPRLALKPWSRMVSV